MYNEKLAIRILVRNFYARCVHLFLVQASWFISNSG